MDESDKTEDDVEQATKDATATTKTGFPTAIKTKDTSNRDIELSDGIIIRNLPKTLDDKKIQTFLINRGLPLNHNDDEIKINRGERNTNVVINGLSSPDIQTLFSSIHFHTAKQLFFDVRLFCKPLRNMTLTKPEESASIIDKAAIVPTPPNDQKHGKKSQIPGLPEKERLNQFNQ